MAVHGHGKGNDDRQIHFETAISETGQSDNHRDVCR